MAMRTVFLVLVFVGCSATPSGPDGGSDCHGAPSGATCRSVAAFTQCGASFEATLAARTLDCDASPGVDGYVGVGACEGLRSIAWNTSTTGETAECFYANDGGALVGALQFTDRGVVLAGGQVASCTREAPPSCQGPTCTGDAGGPVTCNELSTFTRCGASWDETLAARTLDCAAAPGLDGYVAVGACDGLRAVAWNTSFTGETAECFYANDGGTLVGALQFTDRGVVLAGGQVASCTREAPSSCQGPTCIGAPSTAMCVDGAGFTQCRASAALTLSEHAADCDAGAGIVGYVAQGDCGELESVTWTYGFPGDTMECFYERDGGVFTGGLNFTDRGVLASGRVASCTYQPTASCR